MARFGAYFRLYCEFVKTCFASAMGFRAHFVLLIVMDQVFYASVMSSVFILYRNFPALGGWSREHFLFFTGFMLAIDQLHMTFLSENFWAFSDSLRNGKLDFVLLKPMNPIFTVFFRRMRPASLFNFVTPWGAMIYFGCQLNFSAVDWLLLLPLVLAGFCLLVAFEILLSMTMFWTVESFGVNFLRMQFQTLSRWPDFIFQAPMRRIFSFALPVLLVGSAPVKFLFDAREWTGIVWMLLYFVVICVLIRVFWRMGLARYDSASS